LNLIQSILLGFVQGLTEFLPVSSSGHLVITSNILGLKADLAFYTAIHFATLLAILVYFFKDIVQLVKSFFSGIFRFKQAYNEPYFRLSIFIIIGTIPTGIIALLFKDWFEGLFSSMLYVGIFLIISGGLLFLAERFSVPRKSEKDMTILDSIIIGIFQGIAIAPGISRSGSTVSASLFRGLNRTLAARFSFLLAIPAITGAFILELKDITELSLNGVGLISILAGMIAAFISGLLAIQIFIDLIRRKKISFFAYYLFIVGAVVIFFSM